MDPLTCMFYHLRVMDSSDSPLVRNLPTKSFGWQAADLLYWGSACTKSASFCQFSIVIRTSRSTAVLVDALDADSCFLHRLPSIDCQLKNFKILIKNFTLPHVIGANLSN